MRSRWKRFVEGSCKFGDHKVETVQYRSENFYTTTCTCQDGIETARRWCEMMEEQHKEWLVLHPKPENLEKRRVEALERIAAALERDT